MSTRKFFALMLLMSFAVFAVSGCGGGGGGSSNSGGDDDPSAAQTHTITFVSNGGSEIASVTVKHGETYTPPSPTRDGYSFRGWFTDEALTSGYDTSKAITQDLTLYAKWITKDEADVEDAYEALVLPSLSVPTGTNKIDLPTTIGDGVAVSWVSSNPSVIATDGTINHPAGSDVTVTLTATLSKATAAMTASAVMEKKFSVTVAGIPQITPDPSSNDDEDLSAANAGTQTSAIERLNRNSSFTMSTTSTGNVSSVEGRLSTKAVTSSQTATAVVKNMGSMIGVTTTVDKELSEPSVTKDDYGAEYQYKQTTPAGVEYYGRGVTLSVNASSADALSSNFLTATLPSNPAITQTQASGYAIDAYEETYGISADIDDDYGEENGKQVVYSLNLDDNENDTDYETSPVYAYIFNLEGTTDYTSTFLSTDNTSSYDVTVSLDIKRKVFVDASDGGIIISMDNLHGEGVAVSRIDEMGASRTISVDQSGSRYYMRELQEFGLYLYPYDSSNVVYATSTAIGTPQQVSTYANAIEVLKWYKQKFGRNSVDGNGGKTKPVQIVVGGGSDNASWSTGANKIYIYNLSDRNTYSYSRAVARETIAHEISHGMLETSIGVNFPWSGRTAAINQGYADLFGILMTEEEDWLYGVSYINPNNRYGYNCLRDIPRPMSNKALNRMSGNDDPISNPVTVNNKNVSPYVQIEGVLASHAAYLMSKLGRQQEFGKDDGFDWDKLSLLWYRSMSMGFNASSTFFTVRQNVMRAARKLGYTEDDLQIIRDAFDKEKIYDAKASIYGKITDYSTGQDLAGATVTAIRGNTKFTTTTTASGTFAYDYSNYELVLDAGGYPVTVSKSGYVPFTSYKQLTGQSKDVRFDAALVQSGTGTLEGKIIEANTSRDIPGVTLTFREGWDNEDGSVIATVITDSNGHYTLTRATGYYTVTKVKAGYETSSFNVTIAPGTRQHNSYMIGTDTLVEDGEKIVLGWGGTVSDDLDLHLVGKLSNGQEFHVYHWYNYRTAKDSAGNVIAELDHDEKQGNGHETITLHELDPEGEYDCIVRWYAGGGSWAGSDAVVELYADGERYEYHAPADTDTFTLMSGGDAPGKKIYWHVFKIEKGRLIETGTLHEYDEEEVRSIGTTSIR